MLTLPTLAPEASAAKPRRRRLRLLDRLAVDAAELGQLLGCGERSIRTWNELGLLPKPIRLGNRVLWTVKTVRVWLQKGGLPREQFEALQKVKP